MPYVATFSGPIPPGLLNAGDQGSNQVEIASDSNGEMFIISLLYEMNYRPTIPNPIQPQPMISNPTPDTSPPDPEYQSMIPDPSWTAEVTNTQAPGLAVAEDVKNYLIVKAASGAKKLEADAVAAAVASAAVYSAAVAAVQPVVS